MNTLEKFLTRPSLISVAHSGGQGKTTFAQLLYLHTKNQSLNFKAVSADFLDESGRSKLGKLYPDQVLELGIGADISAARKQNDAGAAIRYWDRMGKLLMEGGNVIDLGANVVTGLMDWAIDRRYPDLMARMKAPPVEFFCVARSGRHAFDDMCSIIRRLTEPRLFHNTRFFVVKNESGGPFQDDFEQRLRQTFPKETLVFLRLPNCHSEIWPLMETRGVSIESVIAFDEEEAIEKLGCDIWSASSGLAELRIWLKDILAQLDDARFLGEAPPRPRILADHRLTSAVTDTKIESIGRTYQSGK